MEYKKIFVTVGTTEFDSLLKRLSERELYEILKNHLGCKELTIQYGRGEKIEFKDFDDIKVQMFGLKDSIMDDIESADLVISHAGAGTCIDVLNRNKRLIVVCNEELMNNHQMELAEQLASENYLIHTSISQLHTALKTFNPENLQSYKPGKVTQFIEYLDDFMGFTGND
ncbi:unnamed protein product [Diamesa serratosioi]